MADATSRPMKKNWVTMTDADDASEARDAAAETTKRSTRRKSPLYDKSDSDEPDTKPLKARSGAGRGFLYDLKKNMDAADSMEVARAVPRRKADEED